MDLSHCFGVVLSHITPCVLQEEAQEEEEKVRMMSSIPNTDFISPVSEILVSLLINILIHI